MKRIALLGFLLTALAVSPAKAALLEAETIADLQASYTAYGECQLNPNNSEQLCFKLFLDPYVQSGEFTLTLPESRVESAFIGQFSSEDYTGLNGYSADVQGVPALINQQFAFQFTVSADVDPQATDILLLEVPDAVPGAGPVEVGFSGENVMIMTDGGQVVDAVEVMNKLSTVEIYEVNLNTEEEVPAPNVAGFSPGGTAWVTVDRDFNLVAIDGTYEGMTSEVTAAHLHGFAGPGGTASPLFGLTVSGGTEGSISGSSTIDPDFDMFLAGQTYINVHTATNGPGEIRGQVIVPEPASWTLLIGSLLGLLGVRRRRKQAG